MSMRQVGKGREKTDRQMGRRGIEDIQIRRDRKTERRGGVLKEKRQPEGTGIERQTDQGIEDRQIHRGRGIKDGQTGVGEGIEDRLGGGNRRLGGGNRNISRF